MHIHGANLDVAVMAPHAVEQSLTREHPAWMLQEMAKQGALPSKYANCPIPTCSACLYGKASKKPTRDKPTLVRKTKRELKPGDVTSVDQMTSVTPGLVAQMSGTLTTKRYRYATVFVDQASRRDPSH